MRMYDIIKRKREGFALTPEEINFVVRGYTAGEIPDYQVSALLMAIVLKGMTFEETATLTYAIRDSGDVMDLSPIEGVKVDKHSSGGVGDKTTLVVAPIVASLGVKVAKMSGRGLGHTGGTVDKLEAIPGFRTAISGEEFFDIVRRVGVAVVGQSGDLAPADKKLYALRDVTATVDAKPLIVSSIMGKKLASGADGIVLDVKTGSGSFMKTVEDAKDLATMMVNIGKAAGKNMVALVTDMDVPLGHAVGNSLEVVEAIETLRGKGPKDLTDICVELAANMLHAGGKGEIEACRRMALGAIEDGSALATLAAMVEAQGGDPNYITQPERFATAPYSYVVKAPSKGYIAKVDAEAYGLAALALGAGRARKEDSIDPTAGLIIHRKTGEQVEAGEPLVTLFTSRQDAFAEAERRILEATTITLGKVVRRPLILDRIV